MTKLEKLQDELTKTNTTLSNARKRQGMLLKKIKDEQQREIRSVLDSTGLSLEEIKARLASAANSPSQGGDVH